MKLYVNPITPEQCCFRDPNKASWNWIPVTILQLAYVVSVINDCQNSTTSAVRLYRFLIKFNESGRSIWKFLGEWRRAKQLKFDNKTSSALKVGRPFSDATTVSQRPGPNPIVLFHLPTFYLSFSRFKQFDWLSTNQTALRTSVA